MPQTRPRWFVLCLDDKHDGVQALTFATHRSFATQAQAQAYAASVAIGRGALVAYAVKDFFHPT
jgi:hypothetical protein